MGFRVSIGLVAGTLLVAMLADALNQPVVRDQSWSGFQSDSSCCSVSRLEARLTSIERRLADTQKSIASINDPPLNEYCTVDLASFGFDDSKKSGYVKTSGGSSDETLVPDGNDNPVELGRHRGVTLLELDAITCKTKNRQRFDTYAIAEDRAQLLEALESAKAGTIIVGITADTPESNDNISFQTSAGPFFARYNMNLTGLQIRDKFAFIMQKGYPKKTLFQRKPRYEESLKMKILLRGSTVSDVTFSRV